MAKRIFWVPLISIAYQVVYAISCIVGYSAGHAVNVMLIIGHSFVMLQGFFMSIAFLTEPMVWLAARMVKGTFISKWCGEQKEYWMTYLRYHNNGQEPICKQAVWINRESLLGDSEIVRGSLEPAWGDFQRRAEFEGLRIRIAYWICKSFLV